MMKGIRNIFILAFSFCLVLSAVGSSSASIQSRKLLEVRLHDYGWESDMAALDLLSNELRRAADSRGYIIIYGARRGRRGEVQKRTTCMKGYMLERRGFRADQITIVHGGFRENAMMELWIVPQGACPPEPTPTVAPEDVKFLKGKAKYSCEV
jgi:hypothetical protein